MLESPVFSFVMTLKNLNTCRQSDLTTGPHTVIPKMSQKCRKYNHKACRLYWLNVEIHSCGGACLTMCVCLDVGKALN